MELPPEYERHRSAWFATVEEFEGAPRSTKRKRVDPVPFPTMLQNLKNNTLKQICVDLRMEAVASGNKKETIVHQIVMNAGADSFDQLLTWLDLTTVRMVCTDMRISFSLNHRNVQLIEKEELIQKILGA